VTDKLLSKSLSLKIYDAILKAKCKVNHFRLGRFLFLIKHRATSRKKEKGKKKKRKENRMCYSCPQKLLFWNGYSK